MYNFFLMYILCEMKKNQQILAFYIFSFKFSVSTMLETNLLV